MRINRHSTIFLKSIRPLTPLSFSHYHHPSSRSPYLTPPFFIRPGSARCNAWFSEKETWFFGKRRTATTTTISHFCGKRGWNALYRLRYIYMHMYVHIYTCVVHVHTYTIIILCVRCFAICSAELFRRKRLTAAAEANGECADLSCSGQGQPRNVRQTL